jgi:hypothetical protein
MNDLNILYNGATILEDDAIILSDFIEKNNIKSIIEFGPGSSTSTFLGTNISLLHSLEYNETWFSKYSKQFSNDNRVKFIKYTNKPNLEIYGTIDAYDMCFVDSPRGTLTCSRMNAVIYATTKTNRIIIHDSRRVGEKQTIQYLNSFGYVETFFNTRKGLSLLTNTRF